ncbi:amino acid adenylation domain-containing protein [Peribacillus butanolivorans]|uniref:amino acid adenylation domain-containing protein n=1 Tax=Peribacillus butanolivorans TaxID=421767 RepID=UPI0036DB80C7
MNNEIETILPLTSLQKGMLFHSVENKSNSAYTVQFCLALKDEGNTSLLESSFKLLSFKHAALRLSFIVAPSTGKEWAVVLKDRKIDFKVLNNYSNNLSSERIIDDFLEADLKLGFDLKNDPLFRAKFINFANENYLVLTFHHIILDGWCLGLILGDLFNYYSRLSKGTTVEELKKEIRHEQASKPTYGDYMKWLGEQDEKQGLDYWEQLLSDYEGTAKIEPSGNCEPTEVQMKRVGRDCSKDINDRVLREIQRRGITPSTLMETVWGFVLQQYTNTKDVVFGKVVSGRNVPLDGIEKMVGLFINTVPVRIKTEVKDTLESQLLKVQDQSLASEQYVYNSLADIQENTLMKSDLIKTLVTFENYYVDTKVLEQNENDSFSWETIKAREETNYDLTLSSFIKGERLSYDLMYNPNMYSTSDIERILDHIEVILRAIVNDISQEISNVEKRTTEDVQVIEDLNHTEKEYPINKTIVELFEEEAAKNPSKTAVVYEGEELSYEELNERANAVAYWLRERGIKPEDCVAIKAERGLEMIIGVLGIIKSGGAYVPIDPKYPEERISYMLTDCSASILLVSGKAEMREECEEVSLSETFGDQRMKTNLPNVNTPTDLIYVIYTSGSTGKPKGAMVEHRNVTKLVRNNGMVELNENTIILQTGSMAFDASTFEVWGALANQGTLILSSEDILFDVGRLKDTIQRYSVNVMWMTVTLYNQVIEEDHTTFNSLSTLAIGGERLTEKTVRILKQQDTAVRLLNGYGPTETTTFATMYEVPSEFTKLPIGKPLNNTTIYIVQEGQLCGVGVPGKIWIGGAGVARGYLNNEALTKEHFFANPFGEGKVYRSGDLGRYLEDGTIEYLGRIDEQVKIRGYRIELSEIEHALLSLNEVKQAVVIDKKTDSDHFIYAYLTSQVTLNVSNVYFQLRGLLPEYAMPSQMMQIDEIPVTTNGKVDKRKLPKIKHESKEHVEPRTEVEKTLHRLFVEVLGVKEISVRDSFMMLGGHSLKAVKLANRIHKELDKKVALSDIIKYQTIEEIALLLEERQTQEYQSLEKAEEKQFYKMSPAQQRMYLQQQLNKDSIVYNIPQLYKVDTQINKDKMHEAIDRLVNRHEILRTTYDLVDGMGVQIIHDSLPIDFKYMIGDIGDIAAYIEPFDLEKGPLFRVKVIVSANESYLFLDIHHSVSDGGSTDIFMGELCGLYNGHELKALDFQYKDYSEWINSKELKNDGEYWKGEFEEIPVVDLPLDFVRPEEQGFKGKMFMKEMDQRIGERVKSFAQKNNVTEYMVFLSIVATLMSKYGRQEDIVIGTPVSGRTHGETEEMLGMFVNTLALHLKVGKGNSYREFLGYTRKTFTEALEHQHYPLETLLEELEIQRDISRNSLFDVAFTFEKYGTSKITIGGKAVEGIPVEMEVSKFDLTFIIQELEEGYIVAIEYDTALFKEATITRMYEHIVSLLENALDNADRKIENISEISEKDRKVIEKINDTDREFPMDKTIVELFEEEVAKNPSKTAVVYEGTELTYEELNERANAVAYWLRERGIKSSDCVAIKAERSLEMVIGVLGIIKSGGAYVPIDPKYPEERISYMLRDSSAKVLLVSGKAEVREECEEVSLSETFGDQRMKMNLPNVNTPTDLIYVIYTSGTTGKPKGAMVEHRNVTKLVRNNGMVELNENTIILQTGSMAFDASTFEVWGALANQGTLILSSEDILFDVSKLKQTIQRYNVNVMWMTVTLYNQIIEEDHTTFNSLSTLAIGGERLTEKTVRILKQQDTAVRLLNGYGPTETTTFATMYEVPSEFTKLPIGKPLGNTTIYIVQEGQLCGVGVPGEIWIGGAGVARGYLNNEALTNERFIANPYGEGNVYRSGDLGRYLEDGTIEYLGRIDEQVKIRGYRIELSEIEHALLSLNEVKQAVVMDKKTDADHLIYSYLTSDSELDMAGVRTSLRQALPEYMIPNRMMQIDKVPVTINGKVDMRQLPEIQEESEDYVEPTTEVEKILHDTFAEVLGLKRISIMESFFILGGDSIKAMRIVSKLRECGYDLKVQNIMHGRTIENIARFVTDKEKNVYEQGLVSGEIITTPIIEQFEKWKMREPNHFNQSVIRKSKLTDEASIRSAVEELLTHHDVLRAVYENKQLVIKEKPITDCYDFYYEEFTTADEGMEQRLAHTMDSIQASINISTGPMVKVGMFNIDEKIYILLVIHHLVVDGVSWRIILEDFETLENQILNDEPKRLPEKTASFKEWANVLKEYQKSEQLLKEKDYWEKVNLEAVESDLGLVETGVADDKREKETVLEKELSKALLTEVHQPFTTEINDILLSALGKTLCDIWNQKSVSIILEGHGREKVHQEIAIDRTVGWFTTMYPMVLTGEDTLQSQIIETKERIRRIPNQGLGYGLLEEATDIGVTFNYLGEVISEDTPIPYGTGLAIAEENQLPGKLALNIFQYAGHMHITVSYSPKYISDNKANEFLAKYESNLKEIAEYCLGMGSVIKTPSDYTLNNMTMNDLIMLNVDAKQVADIYELTSMQSGMTYHNVMNSDTTMYVIQYEIVLSGRIDSKLFEQGLDILQMRHEALRTSFDVNSLSIPLQIVWENRPIEFTSYKPEDHVDSWEEIVEQDLRRGFHLKEDSLIRVTMKEENNSTNMLLSFHHIILDGWCMSLILGDLFNYYSRLSKGTTVEELKQEIRQEQPSKPTYGDYMKWLGEQDEKQGLDYWGQLLEDYEGTAQIEPSGTCEPTEVQMKRVGRDCSKDINDRVLREIQRKGITPSTLMETVWGIVLQQYTNTKDVVFGKVVSGRNVPLDGIEKMVGLFINTVPVRIKTEVKDTLESQLLKVQDQSLASEQYVYNSLADIQENTLMKSDLIKTLVTFENYYVDTKVLEQNENESFSWEIIKAREETNYDLNLSSYMKGNRLSYDLMYNPNMYSASDIERILDHIEVILRAIVNDISQEISNVERRTTEDVQVIEDLNRTEKEYPTNKTIVELFEEEAAINPSKTAVVYEGEDLSYEELNERANAVAYWLRERGIKPEDCVAIKAERGLEMIIGVLGIIKSGGTYVPIDPKYPEERISYMLRDSGAKVLLVSGKAEVREECEEVSLSETFGDQRMKQNLPMINKPTDLLYVIYTSGTTGKPKGAMVENRNVTKLVRNNGMVELNENTVILQTGSMAFDASTFEVWGALANQGTLILSSEDILFDVSQLKDTIQRYGVNTMFMTVALYNQIIEEDKEVFNSVSTLIIGGERLAEKNVRRLKQQDTKVTLYNAYGPTETTTFATLYEIPLGFTKLPIGKPLCNTTIYIVQEGQLCGVGVPGEIWIGGDGVARGYLNNEALTEERFMDNPYGEGKLYRSGDLGRYLEDGNIEFLGRIDEQVKIRGYRIELGEIEHALLSLDEVKQAVVIDKKTDSDHFIYAYLTSQVTLNVSNVYFQLRGLLPEYAMPSQMMQIDEVPVTTNGKVDKRKLPEIQHESKEQVEPRTDVEKTLHNLFVEVLGVQEISVRDSFMMLGGHSLKAVKLANRVHKELDKKVAVSDIIKYQTIEEIALLLEEKQTQEYKSIQKAKEKQYYKMAPAQQQMYIVQQFNKKSTIYNIPQLYKVDTVINKDKMREAIDRLVNRYEILRTTYDLVNGMGVQIIHDSLPIDFKYMIGDIGSIAEYIEPFDLVKGPLFRVKVIVSTNESYLFLDIHHSISDGGSVGIFIKELCEYYTGIELGELEHQYKDYSEWINNRSIEEERKYWLNQLSDIEVMNLPTDFERQKIRSSKARILQRKLNECSKREIEEFARENGVTEYMVFMSALMIALSKLSNQEDIVIGTPVSGRDQKDTEDMMGMFVNTLVLRTNVKRSMSYHDFLTNLKNTSMDAIDNQHYPFELLVNELMIRRTASRNPIFDVMFSFHKFNNSTIEIDGKMVSGVPIDVVLSKFDLNFTIQELEEEYVVFIEYDTSLYKEESIEKIYNLVFEILKKAIQDGLCKMDIFFSLEENLAFS